MFTTRDASPEGGLQTTGREEVGKNHGYLQASKQVLLGLLVCGVGKQRGKLREGFQYTDLTSQRL